MEFFGLVKSRAENISFLEKMKRFEMYCVGGCLPVGADAVMAEMGGERRIPPLRFAPVGMTIIQ